MAYLPLSKVAASIFAAWQLIKCSAYFTDQHLKFQILENET